MDNNFLRPNLIPKQREKSNPLLDGLAFLAIFLVIAAVGAATYFQFVNRGLNIPFTNTVLITGLEKENAKLNEELGKIPVDEQKSADSELRVKIKKIAVFGELFKRHRQTSDVFDFLKRGLMPDISITNFRGDFDKGNIVIDGRAKDFVPVGQQFKVFQLDPDIESVSLESLALRGPDEVGFTFSIRMKPSAIKYIKQ